MWGPTWNLQYYREYSRERERESWDGRSTGFDRERDVGVRPGRPVCAGFDRARRVGRRWADLLGRSAGFERESRDGLSVGRRETWSAGPVPVCERAGREMVLGGNGFGLLVRCRSVRELGKKLFQPMVLVCWFRGKEKGGRIFWGKWFLFSTTRDFGFNFFLIKCYCHVGKWLMKDGQKAPLI
jgi:hypothetical protein